MIQTPEATAPVATPEPETIVNSSPNGAALAPAITLPTTPVADTQPDSEPVQAPSLKMLQIMTDQAHTLSWLASQIERLQQQLAAVPAAETTPPASESQAAIAQLQAENAALRDAIANSAKPEAVSQLQAQIEQLQTENAALRARHTDLEQAHAKLEAFKRLLSNGDSPQTATPATLVETIPRQEPITREHTIAALNTTPASAIYQAVKAWNQQHPEATFAITQSLLERDFRVPRRFVTTFLSQYQATLDAYHSAIGATNTRSHNRQTGRNVETLKAFVKLQPAL